MTKKEPKSDTGIESKSNIEEKTQSDTGIESVDMFNSDKSILQYMVIPEGSVYVEDAVSIFEKIKIFLKLSVRDNTVEREMEEWSETVKLLTKIKKDANVEQK